MDLKTLERDLADNAARMGQDLVADMKAEGAHVADPAQCGVIVRRHFDGLMMTVLLFVAMFVGAAVLGIYWYAHR